MGEDEERESLPDQKQRCRGRDASRGWRVRNEGEMGGEGGVYIRKWARRLGEGLLARHGFESENDIGEMSI